MDLWHFAKSPSLPLGLNEQQSVSNANTTPRPGVAIDIASRKVVVCSRNSSSRSCAIDWVLKHYPELMLSSPLNFLGEPQTWPFFDSMSKHASYAAFKENSLFSEFTFPHKRIGRKCPCQSRVAHWAQKLGKQSQKLPAKKLRKSPDACTDDTYASGIVEQVTIALDDSEGPEDIVNFDRQSSSKSPSKKRRWLMGTLKCACSVGGVTGTFAGFHRKVGDSNLEYSGGNGSGQNSGPGGGWGGGGGDNLEPGNFGANNEGFPPVDLNASNQDMEEERGSFSKKQDEHDLDMASQTPGENAVEMPRNERKDFTSCNEGSQIELLESDCPAEVVVSESTSQRLNRAVRELYSELLVGQLELSDTSLNLFDLGSAQVHGSVDVTSWKHDDGAMQPLPQYLEEDVGAEVLAEPLAMKVLEKVKWFTLRPVQASMVGKEKLQAQKSDLLRGDERIPHHGGKNIMNSDEQSGTSVASFERVQASESQRVVPSNDERELTSSGETFTCPPSESELYTKSTSIHLQKQSILDWFVKIARTIVTNEPVWQSRSGKEKIVEERKLNSLVNDTVAKEPVWLLRSGKEKIVVEEKLNSFVNETVASALKDALGTDGNPLLAKQAEIEALRRLQRETFSDLLKLRERLDKIEQSTSTRNPPGVSRTHLKGEVRACTAVVMMEESSSRQSRASLEQAGIQTGLDVRFTFETPFREKDLLITQCMAGQGCSVGDGRTLGGPITLGKVFYLAQMNDDVSISFVPLGAQAKDVTEIINPLQDQGLTTFSSNGPALFNHCKGSALAATVSGGSCAFSLAQYLSGWGNYVPAIGPAATESDALCLSTVCQFLFQPSERIIFSFAGLNRYWPSPPLPSSMGLHWSELGPLVIPKIQSLQRSRSSLTSQSSLDTSFSHAHSIGSNWGIHDLEYTNDSLESKGTAMQSIAVATEVDLGENISVGGWVQIERGDWLQDSDMRNSQWAVNLAKNSGSGIDWGVSMGGSRPDFWNTATNDQEGYSGYTDELYVPQLHLEAFLKINCGRGFTLQPGLFYVLNKHSHTPALMVRSSWSL